MANELRRLYNSMGGLVEDNPLADAATVLTSAGLAALPVVGATEHVPIVLDPDGLEGAPVIKYITDHLSGATTATITGAAQEGTVARAVSRDIPWVVAVTEQHLLSLPQRGAGTPEGVVTAPVGTLYIRTDGGAATTLYVKESGAGNVGWVAK